MNPVANHASNLSAKVLRSGIIEGFTAPPSSAEVKIFISDDYAGSLSFTVNGVTTNYPTGYWKIVTVAEAVRIKQKFVDEFGDPGDYTPNGYKDFYWEIVGVD